MKYEIMIGQKEYIIEFDDNKKPYELSDITVNGKKINIDSDRTLSSFLIDDKSYQLKSYVIVDGRPARISIDDYQLSVLFKDKDRKSNKGKNTQGKINSPLQGIVSGVSVKKGDQVSEKQVLLTVEAMKMQNEIRAPFEGTVKSIKVQEGKNIKEGDELIEIIPNE